MLARPLLLLAVTVLACPTSLAAQESSTPSPTGSLWSALDASPRTDFSCLPLSLLDQNDPGSCSEFHLDDGPSLGDPLTIAPASDSVFPRSWANHRFLIGSAVAGGVVVGNALSSYLDTPHEPFHFTNEGFFGEDTYAGGADKASHFVDYALVSKELAYFYKGVGFSQGESILMGFGVATVAGLVNEIGDGSNIYGFSWEDLMMDVLGAGAAAAIGAAGLTDLLGFRHGFLLPPAGKQYCCVVEGPGRDYSNEIFTADLHLAGLARRLNWKIGPLRYLQVSATYGVKGYPSGAPGLRERQVGIEIGLDFETILDDLGVTRKTWWGYGLHLILDNVRVPFTSIGFRYDLNHGEWVGPDNGNGYATH